MCSYSSGINAVLNTLYAAACVCRSRCHMYQTNVFNSLLFQKNIHIFLQIYFIFISALISILAVSWLWCSQSNEAWCLPILLLSNDSVCSTLKRRRRKSERNKKWKTHIPCIQFIESSLHSNIFLSLLTFY